MKQPRNCTAIKSLLFLALIWTGALAYAAQAAGTVTHLSGPLLAKKADGTIRILALQSEVEPGDTLVTQKSGYAQIKFSDDSRLILQPNTTLTIDKFSYDAAKPDGDSVIFILVTGGLRSSTGLLGKRNKEKFALKTPTATIGIRGTTFIAQYVPPPSVVGHGLTKQEFANNLMNTPPGKSPATADAKQPVQPRVPPAPTVPQLPPGLYVQVTDGLIMVTNNGGSLGFQAGQFGFVPSVNQPPIIVPSNPGLHFTPPPTFNASTPTPSGNANSNNPKTVDCIVR